MKEQWDELKETIIELRDNNGIATQQEVCQFLANLINMLEAQMETERKKGKWKQGYCSECGYNWGEDAPIASVSNFCPNCGADMRGEEDGNQS